MFAVLFALVLATPAPVLSVHTLFPPIEPPKEWTQEMVKELARDVAEQNKLNVQHFLHTLNGENGFNAKGQSNYVDKNGDREDSWGACQINLYFNPTILRAQAEDPAFCISWMAKEWSEGRAWKWSVWKLYERIGWPTEVL